MNDLVAPVPDWWMAPREPYWSRLNIAECERIYGGTYIGDFALKDRNGKWTEAPAAVFYVANPDTAKGHKHYVGLFVTNGGVLVADATIVSQVPWNGIIGENNELILLTYRHDFRSTQDNSVFVDGGQDYLRIGGSHLKTVSVMVDGATWTSRMVDKRQDDRSIADETGSQWALPSD